MDRARIGKASIENLLGQLVSENSVSTNSNVPITQKIADWLKTLDFDLEWIGYKDRAGVDKASLVAKRTPTESSLEKGGAAYLAHTDVVPVDDWYTGFNGPFEIAQRDSKLYGRGTCDMKGSLCCAIQAASRIDRNDQTKPIFFVITADEEIGMEGAQQVDKRSQLWEEMIRRDVIGIIGEPTEMQVVHAHKGTYGISLRSSGQSAHTSTGRGINANDALIPALQELLELKRQTEIQQQLRNEQFDPPTVTLNMVLRNEPLAINVTTALAEAQIFFRTMPQVDTSLIQSALRRIQSNHKLEWIDRGEKAHWSVDPKSPWIEELLTIAGQSNSKTVCYGTDGSVLQRLKKLVVCGPGSIEQAHRKDEWVSIHQLHRAVEVYERAFRKWAC